MSRPSPADDPTEALDRDLEYLRRYGPPSTEVDPPSEAEVERVRQEVDRLVADDRGLLARARSLPRGHRIALVAAVLLLEVGAVLLFAPRADLGAYPTGVLTVAVAVLLALGFVAGWRLLRPLHLPASGRLMEGLLIGTGLSAAVALALVPVRHTGAPAGEGLAFWLACLRCLAFGGALGLPVGWIAGGLRRSTVGGAAVAALAGLMAGLAGNLYLQLHCPITDPAHLLLGHAPLVALGAVVAAAVSLRHRQVLR